jgi:hypothetical protein
LLGSLVLLPAIISSISSQIHSYPGVFEKNAMFSFLYIKFSHRRNSFKEFIFGNTASKFGITPSHSTTEFGTELLNNVSTNQVTEARRSVVG